MDKLNELESKKKALEKQVCFAEFTAEETDVLAALLIEKLFKAEEIIVNEGDPVDSVYLIVSGDADVRKLTIKNNTTQMVSVATLHPGEAIGLNDSGFYSISGVRTASVFALTDMVTFRLSVPAFHGFALTYSHVNEVMRRNAAAYTG